ncbi:UDP-N-acetylmuramate dehydrogenase [Anaerolinea thermophila]|uniref:UDP-N-acetylenolpyruvoylglucosamine reductase n=1 Tax=Anaerolinea thermophila (strain DSM 14523 / JCM 11388 / NBRC 100420 / UNI-1) TaxID=926569 RepID=E8MYN2_ANATU|nr:UDP-N-acetylmuramate dehydrogenase [Anaerolinea thermophila]BAJ64368.1 UDP-N-acetylenolpyruvoylglucosamine reductase [Anaerolinea thermophila UNI-1]
MTFALPMNRLREAFGDALQENVPLAAYTTARVGGPADAFLPVHDLAQLERAVRLLWDLNVPYLILGSGSNLLVSDAGYRGVVIFNRARNVKIDVHHQPPSVWAESGANLSHVARQTALRGLSGLEWAATVPGTVGGAVYGNAGAFGGDMAGNLALAEILHPELGKVHWSAEEMGYGYRTSILKREKSKAVILAARMNLTQSTVEEVQARIETFSAKRRATQPPGATMGSMFKNPPGDYAGRLIEAAGLKGKRIGKAEISPVHANFFVNLGGATAADILQLIQIAQKTVQDKFGVTLELEIECIGEWENF